MADHPIVPTDVKKLIGTRVQEDILPIIPAGAKLKETSSLSEAQLGKIPGRFDVSAQAWVGFGSWTGNVTSAAQLERWEMWQLDAGPIAPGLQTDEVIPIDLDSDNPKYAEMQRRVAEKHFGVTRSCAGVMGQCARRCSIGASLTPRRSPSAALRSKMRTAAAT